MANVSVAWLGKKHILGWYWANLSQKVGPYFNNTKAWSEDEGPKNSCSIKTISAPPLQRWATPRCSTCIKQYLIISGWNPAVNAIGFTHCFLYMWWSKFQENFSYKFQIGIYPYEKQNELVWPSIKDLVKNCAVVIRGSLSNSSILWYLILVWWDHYTGQY